MGASHMRRMGGQFVALGQHPSSPQTASGSMLRKGGQAAGESKLLCRQCLLTQKMAGKGAAKLLMLQRHLEDVQRMQMRDQSVELLHLHFLVFVESRI